MPRFFGRSKEKDEKTKKAASGSIKVARFVTFLPVVVKVIAIAMIVITVMGFLYDIFHWQTDLDNSTNNPEHLYYMIGSRTQSLHDLITVAGNEENGYYLAFKEGADERLEDIIEAFKQANYQTVTDDVKNQEFEEGTNISKEILLKMIQAELFTQYPHLGGTVGHESNIALGQDTKERYAGGVMDIPNIYQTKGRFGVSAANAMVLSYLTGSEVKEADVEDWVEQQSSGFSGDEGNQKFFEELAKHWNVGHVTQCESMLTVQDALKAGRPVIAKVGNRVNTLFTDSTQFIVLKGLDENGKVHVNNPCQGKSEGTFDLETQVSVVAEKYYVFNSKKAIEEGVLGDSSTSQTNNTNVKSVAGFLFIGDSITAGMNEYKVADVNCTFKAVVGKTAQYWLNHYSELTNLSDVNGINIMLGTNNYKDNTGTVVGQLKELVEKLHSDYPRAPIYVDKILPIRSGDLDQSKWDAYNTQLTKLNLSYVTVLDVSEGIQYEPDGMHPTVTGSKTLWSNIQKQITENKQEKTSSTTTQNQQKLIVGEDTGEGLEGFQGAVRIRRVTPNKPIGAVSSAGAGPISSTQNTSGAVAGDIKAYLDKIEEGNWAVYAQNLETNNEEANINGDNQMQSANLIKLFIMAAAYQDMKDNGTQYNTSDIEIMIKQSDNDAANRLIDQMGFHKINTYITQHGYMQTIINRKMLESSSSGDNYTSVKDVAKILKEIYDGTCVSQEASQEMLGYLKAQTEKSKIPAGVPSGVQTANKTGELATVQNDAAIVYKEGAPYILVVMSSNVTETTAVNHIVQISKMTYEKIGKTAEEGTSGNQQTSTEKHTIAIVAGHGDSAGAQKGWYEAGAEDTTGTTTPAWQEKDITLKVANYVKQIFEKQYPQFTVVTDGYSVKNEERLTLAKNAGAELFVGVHFNSNASSSVRGTGVYYERESDYVESTVKLANALQASIMKEMGTTQGEGVTAATYDAFNEGRQNAFGGPALYVEGAFMSNKEDMEIIAKADDEGLKAYAKGIVDGILTYYGVENTGYGDIETSTSGSTSTTNEQVSTTINSKVYDLKYIPEEKFNALLESPDVDESILQYYTLDEDWKLITAKWSYSTAEGIKFSKNSPINYTTVLQKYTTPFEYLMDFYIDIKNDDFILDFANLALESEFIIAVQDNVTTTKVETTTKIVYDDGVVDGPSTEVQVTENVNTSIELTYADTWFVKFSKASSYQAAALQVSGGQFTGEQGELIDNYHTTAYCYTCNDINGHYGTDIGSNNNILIPNLSIAVTQPKLGGDPHGLDYGDFVMIYGHVYRVDDCGTGNGTRPWLDIYVEKQSDIVGPCCNMSQWADAYVPVYRVNNVRPATSNDVQIDGTLLINTIANVPGKTTNNQSHTSTYGPGPSRPAYDEETKNTYYIGSTQYIDTATQTVTHKYETGEGEVTSNEEKFLKLFEDNPEAKNTLKDSWLIRIIEKGDRTASFTDLTKYLLYRITHNKLWKDITLDTFLSKFENNAFSTMNSWSTDISLTTSVMDRDTFIEAMQAYYDKTGNLAFQQNFLSRAGEIYDLGEKYNVNPELIVTMALKESGFKSSGGNQNYWGLGTPNGSSLKWIGSFEEGVRQLADTFSTYMEGSGTWQEREILQRYDERSQANCNSNGYGKPGTLKGMLSIYSDLCGENTKHREGNSGDGGNYYLKIIYGAEFEAKCGSVHRIGVDDYTIQEKADYTAWLYEQQLSYWTSLFGDFATLGGDIRAICEEITQLFLSRNATYGAQTYGDIRRTYESDTSIVCSTYVSLVLYKSGLLKEEKINNYNYHYTVDYPNMLTAARWKQVDKNDLQPGDVLNRPADRKLWTYSNLCRRWTDL